MNNTIYGGTTATPAPITLVDQTYDATSPNAQSGIAVEQALNQFPDTNRFKSGVMGLVQSNGYTTTEQVENMFNVLAEDLPEKPWTLIEDVNLTEAVTQISIPWDRLQVKELYIEGTIIPNDTTISSQTIQMGMSGTSYIQGNQNPKATGKYYVTMRVYKSPSNFTVFDGVISNYAYTSGGTNFVGRSENFNGTYICPEYAKNLWVKSQTANGLGVGTKFKFWGR